MKAVCVINTSGNYGGAEKRIVSLFERINKERSDFLLIINKALYDVMTEKGILSANKRISTVNIPFDRRSYPLSKHTGYRSTQPGKPGRIRECLGRRKYFLKTAFQWLVFSKQLTGILKKHKVRSAYAIWQAGIWGRIWFKRMHVKIIYGANSNLVWHIEKNFLNRFDSQYRILRDADHVDFLSSGLVKELKEFMPAKDFPENYSVSPCSFLDIRNYYSAQTKEDSVVFMGRLVTLKNPMLFLEAVKIFNDNYKRAEDVRFYVLGTGPEEDGMRIFVKNNGLTNVFFEGKVPKPEDYLRRSKVFVSIQQTENYPGQALMEAMACENAIVASNVGETERLVSENEGELVRLEANDIADAIVNLFSNEELLSLKGKNARKKVIAEHSPECFKEYFYNIIED